MALNIESENSFYECQNKNIVMDCEETLQISKTSKIVKGKTYYFSIQERN